MCAPVVTSGFWLALAALLAGSSSYSYVVARACREAEQTHREVERLDAEVEQALRRSLTHDLLHVN